MTIWVKNRDKEYIIAQLILECAKNTITLH